MKYTLTDNPLKTSLAWNLSIFTGFFNLWFLLSLVQDYIRLGHFPIVGIVWIIPIGCTLITFTYCFPILLLELICKCKLRFKFFTSFVPYNFVFYPTILSHIFVGLFTIYAFFPY